MSSCFRKKFLFTTLLMLSVLSVNAWAAKDTAFFPLAKIRPGMTGTAYTVVSGAKIQPFQVKFLGVLSGDGAVQNLLLVQVSGKALEEFGGIAAGMSGSPVFVRGKLVGAIGYGFQNADPQYGLVTPIEDMMRLLEYNKSDRSQPQVFKWRQGGFAGSRGVVVGMRSPGPEWLEAKPVATPVCIAGLGERAYQSLVQAMPKDLIHTVRVPGTAGSSAKGTKLRPGSAIGIQLVTGDYQVTAIGTLTWIQGNRFLAFGHPFMNKGQVDYYVCAAEIYKTIPSTVFPFKLGGPLDPVGRLNQDRSAGIAGIFGEKPDSLEVKIEVTDLGKDEKRTFRFYPVHDESLLKELVVSGALEAVDRVLDRIGTGTARVQMKITGEGFAPIIRTNLFYGQDVAASSFKELIRLLDTLLGNEFQPVRLSIIDLEVIVSPERKTARILELAKPAKKYKPGEKIRLDVPIRPYRGKDETIPVWVTLPAKAKPGRWLLTVRGGGEAVISGETKQEEKSALAEWAKTGSLQELINDFLASPTNNMLVVEGISLDEGEKADTDKGEGKATDKPGNNRLWTGATSYYLTGETQVMVEFVPANGSNASGKNASTNVNTATAGNANQAANVPTAGGTAEKPAEKGVNKTTEEKNAP